MSNFREFEGGRWFTKKHFYPQNTYSAYPQNEVIYTFERFTKILKISKSDAVVHKLLNLSDLVNFASPYFGYKRISKK